jgi:hypothetical protein
VFVVRYLALAALVVWLSAQLAVAGGTMLQRIDLLTYACGAIVLVCLFLMKFVGPPPRSFIARAVLVAVMIVVAIAAGARSTKAALVNAALGAVLLGWYVREGS